MSFESCKGVASAIPQLTQFHAGKRHELGIESSQHYTDNVERRSSPSCKAIAQIDWVNSVKSSKVQLPQLARAHWKSKSIAYGRDAKAGTSPDKLASPSFPAEPAKVDRMGD
ncbi:uncharacterized protein MEPE_04341 [Melanopsichium pennsylvanicum]|uniref:Uncharacterized protein n=1 Tax=Melanopsichium pennsylvanicum TaxID=63383 RepID=A0AAJ4XPQ8_9BASI|nr:uncharacterized protein MEPE_04341 [Melanopsichium pennsylvanicum]